MELRAIIVLGLVASGALGALACGSSASTDAAGAAAEPADDLHLPDALTRKDGRRVTSQDEWPERRAEIVDMFASQIYGRAPGRPEQLDFHVVEDDPAALGGAATLRRVAIESRQAGRTHSFEVSLFAPNGKRSGTFLLLSTKPPSATDPTRATKNEYFPVESVVARGYAIATIQTNDLAPDDKDTYASGVIRLFEGDAKAAGARPADAWKAIAAWSWGASRAMDYLVTDPLVDPARVAVIGHSRGGKAALWAGAQDTRFSLTISNESGCAGAALSRRPVGETVDLVNAIYPHWFAENFRAYNGKEDLLPVDQHMLLALLAPRAAVVASASEDTWSDPEGEYLGLAYASSVYALWGFAPVLLGGMPPVGDAVFIAPRAYHLRPGTHALTQWDWDHYVNVADQVWPR